MGRHVIYGYPGSFILRQAGRQAGGQTDRQAGRQVVQTRPDH